MDLNELRPKKKKPSGPKKYILAGLAGIALFFGVPEIIPLLVEVS